MLLILRVTEEKWWCCNTRGRGANHLIDDGWMGSKKAVMVAESSQRSGQPGAGTLYTVQDKISASPCTMCKSNDPNPNLQEGVTIATCPNV